MDAATPAVLRDARAETTRALLVRLWREHIRHHRRHLLVILVLTLVMAGLTALYPVVIDHAFAMFAAKDRRILYQVPALILAVTAARAAALYAQNVRVQQVVLLVIRELQDRMFAHLARADLARVEREAPAALAARFTTDAAIIRESLTRAVNGVADAMQVVGLIASMIYLDWVLSLVALALYPVAVVPVQRIGRRIRRASGGMQERMGEAAALLNESFAQARTVRTYGLEEAEDRRAAASFHELYRALLRMARSRARLDPVMEVLGGAAVAAVLGFAGWRAAVGAGNVGVFTGFVSALIFAARPLRGLGSLNAALQEGLAGLARVFSVIDEPPGILDTPGTPPLPPGRGHLCFEQVRFAYPDGRHGLLGLSFEAEPGLTVALVGPSGAGKSTALSLIPRLYDVGGGRILLDGADLRAVSLASLRAAIAYVGRTRCCSTTPSPPISAWGGPRRARPSWPRRRSRRRRLHRRPAGGDGDAGRPRRPAAVRRPAPAGGAGPRAAAQSAHPAARRGDQRARRRERGGGAGGAGTAARRAAPRSWSRTACRPCATPTGWWRWRTDARWSRAPMRSCWPGAACMRGWCGRRPSRADRSRPRGGGLSRRRLGSERRRPKNGLLTDRSFVLARASEPCSA